MGRAYLRETKAFKKAVKLSAQGKRQMIWTAQIFFLQKGNKKIKSKPTNLPPYPSLHSYEHHLPSAARRSCNTQTHREQLCTPTPPNTPQSSWAPAGQTNTFPSISQQTWPKAAQTHIQEWRGLVETLPRGQRPPAGLAAARPQWKGWHGARRCFLRRWPAWTCVLVTLLFSRLECPTSDDPQHINT